MPGKKGMGRAHLIPEKLPCGCPSVSHSYVRGSTMLLHDGTRVCRDHGKRYRLIFQEVKIGEEA